MVTWTRMTPDASDNAANWSALALIADGGLVNDHIPLRHPCRAKCVGAGYRFRVLVGIERMACFREHTAAGGSARVAGMSQTARIGPDSR